MIESNSVLLRDADTKAVQLLGKWNLARQTRVSISRRGAVEEVVLVLGHGGQVTGAGRVNVDMARGARQAAAAKGNELVDPGIPDVVHNRLAGNGRDFLLSAIASGDE